MKTLISIACVLLGMLIVALFRSRKITPDMLIIAVRTPGKNWQHYLGSIRDAKFGNYRYAALKDGSVIDLATGKRNGRKLRDYQKK